MDREFLENLLGKVKQGTLEITEAVDCLRRLPFEDLGYAKIDHHRSLRTGFPEVVFCQGKQPIQVAEIVERLLTKTNNILATRAGADIYEAVLQKCPNAKYHDLARCITVENNSGQKFNSPILVISAGTADLPVAEEAAVTAEIMGNTVNRLYDVGVAGIHRLFYHKTLLDEAAVIIVVAGMEGALASVVGGLVDVPVVAVPTSIGYGTGMGGIAALLAMLNSCASGLSVVNIDNGFGAAAMAASIIRLKEGK
ncbi:MAG TPA: nickel pincer cofactor biosynthesis protein LarB [Desulfobacteria bacterium]|nr:nickel pincer cofactor biosynthesis protein LarB [Desulfobacteria bacterium]